jgi:triacylglycerol esterase/lipase EstA (alpha/beta hydrolase family)
VRVQLVWLALVAIAVGVVFFQFTCFTIALYEAVNQPDSQHVRLTPAGLASALAGFVRETLGVLGFVFARPLGLLPWRRVVADDPLGRPPLVFVPGWWMNRACFVPLRYRLARDGWPNAIGLNYRTLHGNLRHAAERLRDTVERVRAETRRDRVVLIGHSMGGIVCRLYLKELGGLAHVRSVITLGSPHQGTKLAALSLDPMVQDLRPDSPFMEELAHDDSVPGAVDFTAIYSSFDHVVVPAGNASYPGVGNIVVEGVGHMGLLWSSRVYALIRESLDYACTAEGGDDAGRGDDAALSARSP